MESKFQPKVDEHDYQSKAETAGLKVETRWGALIRIVRAGLMAWLAGTLFVGLGMTLFPNDPMASVVVIIWLFGTPALWVALARRGHEARAAARRLKEAATRAALARRQEEEQAAAAERAADRAALARLQAIQTADRQAKLRAELEATGLPEADIERICEIQARRDAATAASLQDRRQSGGKAGGAAGASVLGHLAGGAVAGVAAGTAVAVVSDLMTDDEGVAASVIEANEALTDAADGVTEAATEASSGVADVLSDLLNS